jgi:hypothetical protein
MTHYPTKSSRTKRSLHKSIYIGYFVLVILLLAGSASAFQVKYYGSHYEEPINLDGMQGIPSYYFEEIKAVRIYEEPNKYFFGRYFASLFLVIKSRTSTNASSEILNESDRIYVTLPAS